MRKKTISAILIALTFLVAACSSGAPEAAKKAFHDKFPGAKDVEWSQEEEDVWEAEFEMESTMLSACFSATGDWIETESDFAIDALPDTVIQVIAYDYAEYEIIGAELVETPEFTAYELDLAKIEETEAELEVTVTPEGKVISSEQEEDAAEEDQD